MQLDIENYLNNLCCVTTPVTSPTIFYNSFNFTFDIGVPVNECPTITGDLPITLSINKTLPAGLTFDSNTGCITGTPTAVTASDTYEVQAVNAGGSSTASLIIEVTQPIVATPPTIEYNNLQEDMIAGNAVNICPTILTGDAPITVTVSPSLPVGLSLDSTTGCITGTPTTTSALSSFTFTATNSAGTDTFDMDISTTLLPITIKDHSIIVDKASGDSYMTSALLTGSIIASSWDSATNTYTVEVPLGSSVGSNYFDKFSGSTLGNMPFLQGGEYRDPSGLITTYIGIRHFAAQEEVIIEIGGEVTFGDTAFRGVKNSIITLNNFNATVASGQTVARFADGVETSTFNFLGNLGLDEGYNNLWDSNFLPVLQSNIFNARVAKETSNNGLIEGDLDFLISQGETVNFTL